MSARRRMEEDVFQRLSMRLVDFLAAHRIKPIALTVSALILSLASASAYYLARDVPHYYFLAAALLAASGLLDAVDGAVARRLKMATRLGAFLDSVFDKIGEAAVYIAIISSGAVSSFWCSLALASSIMVSYVRHRAEPLKVDVKGVGFMERAERLIFLIAASILTPFIRNALEVTIILIAVFASMTVAWRMIHVSQALRSEA